MPDAAWQIIAEVMMLMQIDLDRDWSLDEAARIAGYEPHHFARSFTEVVGHPPARYVRLMRLERAAEQLANTDKSVLEVAISAGYGSGEAFGRAFRRTFRSSPRAWRKRSQVRIKPWGDKPRIRARVPSSAFPPGLRPPTISKFGPLFAWTLRVPSFAFEHVGPALAILAERAPVDGPWQLGGLAQPWGWVTAPAVTRDLRLVRYLDAKPKGAAPPILPWRLQPSWYATFEFRGPMFAIPDVINWILKTWIPSSGMRSAFLPTLSCVEHMGMDPVSAKLHVGVRRL